VSERRLFAKLLEGFDSLDRQGKLLVTNEVERGSSDMEAQVQGEQENLSGNSTWGSKFVD
jgi:hypothetical protein